MSDEYAPQWSADATVDPEPGSADPPPAEGEDIVAAAGTDEAAGMDETADAAPADDGSSFLTELVRAMQTTAGAERARVAEDTDRRREAHLATIQEQREAESAKIRELADEDLKAIDAWADEERQRIDAERERRATALRDDLERSLAEHGAKVDREIDKVEAAITAYRADTDAFFSTLDRETDPVAIAQHAGQRPTFPVLESITAESITEAPSAEATGELPTAETAEAGTDDAAPDQEAAAAATGSAEAGPAADVGVGVMDRGFSPKLADAWATWSDAHEQTVSSDADGWAAEVPATSGEPMAVADEAAPATASGEETQGPESLEVVAVTSSASSSKPEGILKSMPVNRPMSWLRRGSNNETSKEE